jgi:IPT/TIG domain
VAALVVMLSVALGGQALAAEPPTVTKVEAKKGVPEEGPFKKGVPEGGNLVTITGTNLTGATAVKFGSTGASPFAVNSPTSVNAVSPPEPAGTVDVTVTTPGGTSATSSADKFEYLTLPECFQGHNPVVTGVEPAAGPPGTSVKVFGERFFVVVCGDIGLSVQYVIFGAEEASFNESQRLTVAPLGTGTVDVRVEMGTGELQRPTSAVSPADHFTLIPNAPIVETKAASSITPTSATLSASVNPNGREVSECKLEYGPTTSYGSSAPCTPSPGSGESPVAVSASVTGLTTRTTYHFRISATNSAGRSVGFDEAFKTLPPPPAVTTKAASSVLQTKAVLHGIVNPNGSEVTDCHFEYGTTTSYGSNVPCTPPPGAGTTPVEVTAEVFGLTANTTYHYKLSATNAGGVNVGSDETFQTLATVGSPPTALTAAASSVTRSSVTLNATVNPDGGEVYECKLEYGTTTSYGSSAACSALPGHGESPVAVSASVTGLTPNTTYHFRISATNPGGTSAGGDETFKTQPFIAPTVITGATSSISQTSATANATVNPNGGEVSECKLEYGTTTSYGSSAVCSALPGHGESPVTVSSSLEVLSNKTTYHFRISATNPGGTSKGQDQTFTAASVHIYKNGVKGAEGKKVRTIGWGTLKFTNAAFGEVECHTVSAGYLEDPPAGSAVGQVQGFYAYECVSESCKVLGGSSIALTAEQLPWSTEATEAEGGGFRLRTGNRVKAAGAALVRVNCGGVKSTQFFAEDAPRVLNNGISIGSGPNEVEFDQPGSGELESEALGGLKFAGKVKTEGYGAEELIEVKNP